MEASSCTEICTSWSVMLCDLRVARRAYVCACIGEVLHAITR
jgi:hypothetical protein